MPIDHPPRPTPIPSFLIYVCFFGSGLTSLVYELLWVRRLNLIFGSTTYSVTTVLAAFMAGLGVGGYLIGRRVDTGRRGLRTYAYLELGVAVLALCSLPMLRGVEWAYAALQGSLGLGQGGATLLKFIMAFPVLAFPAALMGGTLPALTLAVVRRREALHKGVGLLYGINTVGAAVGTILAGVLLIQHLGLWRSVLLCASINLIIGLVALWVARRCEPAGGGKPVETPARPEPQLLHHLRKPAVAYSLLMGLVLNLLLAAAGLVLFSERKVWRLAGAALVVPLGAAASLQPAWAAEMLDAGIGHRMANNVPRNAWRRLQMLQWGGGRLAYFKEGLNATVSVRQFDHGTALLVNGKADASTDQDMTTQVMLGQIPMLVHSRPQAVAVVGWGSGVTAYTTTFFPEVKRVDVMEIESAAVEASRFFHRLNGAAERHPKVHIHCDDARSYLLSTQRRFDVLISEPSNPWMAGVANLFSRDLYELAKKRLAPGGIFGQWLQLYRMDSSSVAMVFRTMLESFPHVQVWFTDRDNLILLGSDEPLRPSVERVRKAYEADDRIPRYMAAFGSGMLPEQFFGAFLLGQADLKRLVDRFEPELMTDDRPVLEYRAMAGLYHRNHPHWDSLWRLKLEHGAFLPPVKGPAPPVSAAINGAARVMGFHTMASGRISAWGMKHYPDKPFIWLTRARFHEEHGNQLEALIGAKKHAQAWTEVEALLGQLDRTDDADLLKVQRQTVYSALDRLIVASRQYSRGIKAATLRKEEDGGEVSRLDALVDAQVAAKVPPQQIIETVDQLRRFGLTNIRHLKVSERLYREAGRLDQADALALILRELSLEPEGKPLWPIAPEQGAQ